MFPGAVPDGQALTLGIKINAPHPSTLAGDLSCAGTAKGECTNRIAATLAPTPRSGPRLRHLAPGRTYMLADNGPRETFEQWVARYSLNRLFAYTINSERDGLTKAQASFRGWANTLAGLHRVNSATAAPRSSPRAPDPDGMLS